MSMKTQSPDTHPGIEKRLIEGLRRMSAAEKFERLEGLNQFLEMLALTDIRQRHPEADVWECRLRVASRRVPPELLKKAFGWDVEEKGY
jgi:hypothetical protein